LTLSAVRVRLCATETASPENPVNFLPILERQHKAVILLIGFLLVGMIGLADYSTGYEFAFSVFYVLPIFLVTWFTNGRLGLCAALASAIVWFGADLGAGHPYSNPFIPVWNALIRLAFFVIITRLLSALRAATERERELARVDYLTGAMNSRLFYDVTQMEIDRCQRYKRPFTVAYIDLDNFKMVNDRYGHAGGDEVLRGVVRSLRRHARKTDVVARLGGDEFALLLPETDHEFARVALTKLHAGLLEEMRRNEWPVTFSIGVLTCCPAPSTAKELIRIADELMYAVKRETKNGLRYSVYVDPQQPL